MAVLGLALTAGSTIASAQNTINLDASSTTLTFSGDSSASMISFTLGALCPNNAGICKADQSGGPTGHYDITGSPTITLTLTNGPAGQWSVGQTSPLTFSFCSHVDCAGAGNVVYLSGSLQLTDLVQSPGASTGTFNYSGDANLTGLSGTLAASWTAAGIVTLNLNFTSHVNIETLLNEPSSHKLHAKVGSGTVDPTPEPTAMVLFGTGLLAVGIMLRRRLLV